MKKIYRQPTLKILTINLEDRMMAGSDNFPLNETPTTGSLSKDDLDTDTWGW